MILKILLNFKTNYKVKILLIVILISFLSCNNYDYLPIDSDNIAGCDGQIYPNPNSSPYSLPFEIGKSYSTGLTNCTASYHSEGKPDQYAFDFNMPYGTFFLAARGGTVYDLVENAGDHSPNFPESNIKGNYVIIDHGDGTFGIYLHSPDDGISVELNDKVKRGQILGIVGQSGLAGYPHLHFIVVKGKPVYPYEGVAISFNNASPKHTVLQRDTEYKAVPLFFQDIR